MASLLAGIAGLAVCFASLWAWSPTVAGLFVGLALLRIAVVIDRPKHEDGAR